MGKLKEKIEASVPRPEFTGDELRYLRRMVCFGTDFGISPIEVRAAVREKLNLYVKRDIVRKQGILELKAGQTGGETEDRKSDDGVLKETV